METIKNLNSIKSLVRFLLSGNDLGPDLLWWVQSFFWRTAYAFNYSLWLLTRPIRCWVNRANVFFFFSFIRLFLLLELLQHPDPLNLGWMKEYLSIFCMESPIRWSHNLPHNPVVITSCWVFQLYQSAASQLLSHNKRGAEWSGSMAAATDTLFHANKRKTLM